MSGKEGGLTPSNYSAESVRVVGFFRPPTQVGDSWWRFEWNVSGKIGSISIGYPLHLFVPPEEIKDVRILMALLPNKDGLKLEVLSQDARLSVEQIGYLSLFLQSLQDAVEQDLLIDGYERHSLLIASHRR